MLFVGHGSSVYRAGGGAGCVGYFGSSVMIRGVDGADSMISPISSCWAEKSVNDDEREFRGGIKEEDVKANFYISFHLSIDVRTCLFNLKRFFRFD